MKSNYIFGSVLLLMSACAHSRHTVNHPPIFHGVTVMDSDSSLMLLGEHPRTDLTQPPFGAWFNVNYAVYTVDSSAVRLLRPLMADQTFEIFMGTWCGDSRREVPRLFKILDACGIPAEHIRLILLDHRDSAYKQSPGHEERGMGIHHVPDLLVLHQGMEKGRIVESPMVSLEKDLLSILTGAPYDPHYPAAYWLSIQFRTYDATEIEARFDQLADSLNRKGGSESELPAYSRVLFLSGDTVRSLLACRLNTAVFPKSAYAFSYLGKAYFRAHDLSNARKAYYRALEIDPANGDAEAWLSAHPD